MKQSYKHMRVLLAASLAISMLIGCSGGKGGGSGNKADGGENSIADGAVRDGVVEQADAASADGAARDGVVEQGDGAVDAGSQSDAAIGKCPAARLGAKLGKTDLMVGGSMEDADFATSPFDLRYQYLAGDVPDDGPCASCASGCSVRGQSCDNASGGCAWWGCWQYDQAPPGQFVTDFITKVSDAGAAPMITYYIWYSVAGDVEGAPEVAQLADGAKLSAYLADFRFLCQVIAKSSGIPVIIHVEPDFWGYGQQVNHDPSLIPAAVSAASADECAGLKDTMAGFARCLLAIARAEAPNALVGFHASAWGAGADALINSDPNFDLAAHAAQTAEFMKALGADKADLIVVEMSDRDAGYNGRWWDATNATLPNFDQAISWVSHLGEELNLPPLWWQAPYGHVGLDDTCDRYQDNRVDYFFDHPEQFAEGGALGIAFGAGADCMTTPATDDGHFAARAKEYYSKTRPSLCGD